MWYKCLSLYKQVKYQSVSKINESVKCLWMTKLDSFSNFFDTFYRKVCVLELKKDKIKSSNQNNKKITSIEDKYFQSL